MPHEAVAEILVGLLEVGVEAGTSGDNKNKPSCVIVIIIFLVIVGTIIYYNVK